MWHTFLRRSLHRIGRRQQESYIDLLRTSRRKACPDDRFAKMSQPIKDSTTSCHWDVPTAQLKL